jgi:hypothetical protein
MDCSAKKNASSVYLLQKQKALLSRARQMENKKLK